MIFFSVMLPPHHVTFPTLELYSKGLIHKTSLDTFYGAPATLVTFKFLLLQIQPAVNFAFPLKILWREDFSSGSVSLCSFSISTWHPIPQVPNASQDPQLWYSIREMKASIPLCMFPLLSSQSKETCSARHSFRGSGLRDD